VPTTAASALFPTAAVEDGLRAELIEAIKAEAAIKGIALPAATGAIASTSFQLDSLVVVSLLCMVEPIVGFELSEDVVRPGGYTSIDNAISQLLPRIEAEWKKHIGGMP
jgi:hypothetical protein